MTRCLIAALCTLLCGAVACGNELIVDEGESCPPDDPTCQTKEMADLGFSVTPDSGEDMVAGGIDADFEPIPAGDDGADGPPIQSTCPMQGATECVDGERYRECVSDGFALTWGSPEFCLTALCSDVTQSCCPEPLCEINTKRCGTGGVQTCQMIEGCPTWSAGQACPQNQVCMGDGDCSTPCQSECSGGDRRCVGGAAFETCRDVGGGCMRYTNMSQCGANQACQGGMCMSTCTDECPGQEGTTECSGTTERTCQRQADGCLDWVNTGTCAPKADCFSNSIGGQFVPHGTCVQNAFNNTFYTCSDGAFGCLWAFCNDGNWEYQCPQSNLGPCAGSLDYPHATCN